MRSNAIIFAGAFDSDLVDSRSPRILAPLQHLFDPILGMSDFLPDSRWGDEHVTPSRFSQLPRIVFDHMPALPADLGEAMLYHLQRRLMAERLIGTPVDSDDAGGAGAGVDAGITILPA